MKRIYLLVAVICCCSMSIAQNVGIGVTAPSQKLEVLGRVKSISSGYGFIQTDSVRSLGTYLDANAGWLGTISNHPLWFFTNDGSSPSLVISTTGSVAIGNSDAHPSAKLDVSSVT